MGSELQVGAEVKDTGRDNNQIVFGDALSALSYNDWLHERDATKKALEKTRKYWDEICPCPVPTEKIVVTIAANSSASRVAPEVVPPAGVNRPASPVNFATV